MHYLLRRTLIQSNYFTSLLNCYDNCQGEALIIMGNGNGFASQKICYRSKKTVVNLNKQPIIYSINIINHMKYYIT